MEITKPLSQFKREEEGMARYWDNRAGEYEETHEVADKEHWKDILETYIGPERNLRILDVATGTGLIANMLASRGYTFVTGADLSEQMMRVAANHAKESGLSVDYRYGNAMDLPFEDGCFDIVINSRLLWTLTEPEKAILEWKRVLKPGGKLIAINELEPGKGIVCSNADSYKKGVDAQELPFSNIGESDLILTLRNCGFEDADVRHMEGCHLVNSDRENWFAFIGHKNEL